MPGHSFSHVSSLAMDAVGSSDGMQPRPHPQQQQKRKRKPSPRRKMRSSDFFTRRSRLRRPTTIGGRSSRRSDGS